MSTGRWRPGPRNRRPMEETLDEPHSQSSSFGGFGRARARLSVCIATGSLGRPRCVSARLEPAAARRPAVYVRLPHGMGLERLPAVLAGPDEPGRLREVT